MARQPKNASLETPLTRQTRDQIPIADADAAAVSCKSGRAGRAEEAECDH